MASGLAHYLARHGTIRPLHGHGLQNRSFQQAVIIPVLAEEEELPLALAALASNPPDALAQTVVVLVLNNRSPDAARPGDSPRQLRTARDENQRTLAWLRALPANRFPFALTWIDAASPGQELPDWGGVGLARKIGCDTLLDSLLQQGSAGPDLARFIIFSLDADTWVEPAYLACRQPFIESGRAGGVLPCRHRVPVDLELRVAIAAYERFLDYYVAGLRWAGSAYAFHTIGSAMLCHADAYVKAAGIPARRLAGEDFYFLQQLAKVGGVVELGGTAVHPSARPSWRVPFGTGPRMQEAVAAPATPWLAYDPRVFGAVRGILAAVYGHLEAPAAAILGDVNEAAARAFLEQREFAQLWTGFQRQFRTAAARRAAFDRWFDAFATLKLIHQLTATLWPQVPLEVAVAGLARLRETVATDPTAAGRW